VILLLDVNVLVALAHQGHAEHERVSRWYSEQSASEVTLATCSITELGFVRVSVQAGFETDVKGAIETLGGLRQSSRIVFERLADDLGVEAMPAYVKGPRQVTDGHLLALAARHGGKLVTLDRGIPGALVIA
jgi:toxin-antitoxin system PIN domain toxin